MTDATLAIKEQARTYSTSASPRTVSAEHSAFGDDESPSLLGKRARPCGVGLSEMDMRLDVTNEDLEQISTT